MLGLLGCVQLIVTLWAIVHQSLQSMEFPRQEYWSGLPCPPPGDLPSLRARTYVSYVSCSDRQVLYL